VKTAGFGAPGSFRAAVSELVRRNARWTSETRQFLFFRNVGGTCGGRSARPPTQFPVELPACPESRAFMATIITDDPGQQAGAPKRAGAMIAAGVAGRGPKVIDFFFRARHSGGRSWPARSCAIYYFKGRRIRGARLFRGVCSNGLGPEWALHWRRRALPEDSDASIGRSGGCAVHRLCVYPALGGPPFRRRSSTHCKRVTIPAGKLAMVGPRRSGARCDRIRRDGRPIRNRSRAGRS